MRTRTRAGYPAGHGQDTPRSACVPKRGQSQSCPAAPPGWGVHRTPSLVLTLQDSGEGALATLKTAPSFTNLLYLQIRASQNQLVLCKGVRVPTRARGSFPKSGFINSIVYTKTTRGALRRCYVDFDTGVPTAQACNKTKCKISALA